MRTWQRIVAAEFPLHSHVSAYASVVLAGAYDEAGDHGRFRLSPGNVLFHGAFESHWNRFSKAGAVVLNLRLPCDTDHQFGHIDDLDLVMQTAEKSKTEAVQLLSVMFETEDSEFDDWPDKLARDLVTDPSLILTAWADQNRLSPTTVCRVFQQLFGISPSAFRARARGRRAWRDIRRSSSRLTDIAATHGFADQAHMTRIVKSITGRTPGAWRYRANGFKTS